MSTRALRVSRSVQPPPLPVDRGPWLDAKQISERFYSGRFSPRWIANNVAPDKRRKIGKLYLWREMDVIEFVNAQ